MANYIVGDLQGCFNELQLLLAQVNFSVQTDHLWVAGDLVARGANSLETLRFIKSLDESASVVLGNHDLHLLATSIGVRKINPKDRTQDILNAQDKEELLYWLRNQPLLVEHDEFVMCHAGISPQWDLDTARSCALEIANILQSDDYKWLISNMYGDMPNLWNEQLTDLDRYRYIINSYTRMRFCYADASLDLKCKLPPKEAVNDSLIPWFDLPNKIEIDKVILFGHWAALNGYVSKKIIGLDTGCVWGNKLTMLRWEDKKYFYQDAVVNIKNSHKIF